jgi:hypothetical protein
MSSWTGTYWVGDGVGTECIELWLPLALQLEYWLKCW